MNAPSILVVDDEPDNFDVIETLFGINELLPGGQQDYHLHYAPSGSEAIAALDTLKPDLILLDVMMPGMDGIEVCQRIKSLPKWRPVPIIMVTSLSGKEDLARCLKAGADDFVSKPVNSLELSARVHSMLRLKQQHDDLQVLFKLREDMVNMIVHDLRSPLTVILAGLGILGHLELPPAEKQARITQLKFSAKHLQLLIDELLLVAKMKSGTLRLQHEHVDLQDLINRSLAGFKEIASQKGITLITKIPEETESIHLDKAMFYRVLDNLLSNAIKFSPKNSEIKISIRSVEGDKLAIYVADFGCGVPPSLRHKIFEKYEVGTLKQEVSQIGLGLAFCKMVVEAHGGEIAVTSNQPQGAIFEITLPMQSLPVT